MLTERSQNGGTSDRRSSIQVLARAAEILRALQAYPSGLTQTEIGERIGLSRSTVSRLVLALEAEGLLSAKGPRGRYRLGPEFIRMAATARRSSWQELHPLLIDLSKAIGETVDLSVLDRDRAVFVDQVISENRLQAVSSVGDAFPLHASANGKALMASMAETDVRRITARSLERFTPNTIVDAEELEREIAEIRATGIAFDREEHSEGVSAIGLLIGTIDHDVLAVSIPMPTHRYEVRKSEILDALSDFAQSLDQWVANRPR